ncbi:MAG: response regulator [Candidatus Margulisbacteria bacterium]|nr:response regulator [Candidatus Margulisiibacteriota bacterium]
MAKILVVDDAELVRMRVTYILKNLNHEIIEADNGVMAVELFKLKKPDLTILDITMPLKDGIEALKEIIQINKQAKVIMLTNIGDQNTIIEALEAGAIDYIIKPIQEDVLSNAVKKIFG